MKTIRFAAFLAVCGFVLAAADASAHVVPWRAGEPRMKGFGHCAKGPCMRRYDWSASKPHCHIAGKTVFDRKTCARRESTRRDRRGSWRARGIFTR